MASKEQWRYRLCNCFTGFESWLVCELLPAHVSAQPVAIEGLKSRSWWLMKPICGCRPGGLVLSLPPLWRQPPQLLSDRLLRPLLLW